MAESAVAAIITAHNGRNYVFDAIESCLAQTVPLAEIIVVDDGSTDNTGEKVRRRFPDIRVINQEWSGQGAALNNGILSSGAEFVAFLDHDDVWKSTKTALQLAIMKSKPTMEVVFGHVEQFISPEMVQTLEQKIQRSTLPQPGIQSSAIMIRRSAFGRLGLFSTDREVLAFAEWYARAISLNLISHMLPETVSRRRIHATNFTRSQKLGYQDKLLSFARNAAKLHRSTLPKTESK